MPQLHALGHETQAQAVAESTKVTASHGGEGRVVVAREIARPPDRQRLRYCEVEGRCGAPWSYS